MLLMMGRHAVRKTRTTRSEAQSCVPWALPAKKIDLFMAHSGVLRQQATASSASSPHWFLITLLRFARVCLITWLRVARVCVSTQLGQQSLLARHEFLATQPDLFLGRRGG